MAGCGNIPGQKLSKNEMRNKICPFFKSALLTQQDPRVGFQRTESGHADCDNEKCGLWDTDNNQCSILTLGNSIGTVAEKAKDLLG